MVKSNTNQDAVRVQFELSPDRVEELTRLMEECGIKTRVELINTALTVFEWAIQERKHGRIIASVDEPNQKFKELVVPAFNAVQSSARQLEHALAGSSR